MRIISNRNEIFLCLRLTLNLVFLVGQKFHIKNNICIKLKLSERIKNKRKLLFDSNVVKEF